MTPIERVVAAYHNSPAMFDYHREFDEFKEYDDLSTVNGHVIYDIVTNGCSEENGSVRIVFADNSRVLVSYYNESIDYSLEENDHCRDEDCLVLDIAEDELYEHFETTLRSILGDDYDTIMFEIDDNSCVIYSKE